MSVNNVKQLKKRISELKKSEEKYSVIFEKSPTGITLLNADGIIIDCNQADCDILGYDKENIIGKHITEFFNDQYKALFKVKFRELLETGCVKADLELVRSDGSIVCVARTVSAVFDKNGNIENIIVHTLDITERKKNEQALLKSENQLRSLFNAMKDIVFEMDYDGRYIYIAPTSPELLYKLPDEMLGKTLHEVFPQKQADMFLEFIRKCLDEREVKTIEYPLKIKDKTVWFEGRAVPKSSNTVLYIGRDITSQKESENALKESEEKYRRIFEESKDAIFVSSKDGRFIDINPAGLRLFGYSSVEEIKKIDIVRDLYSNPQDRKKYIEMVEQKGFIENYELHLKKKDGSKIIVLESTTAIYDGGKNIIAFRGIIRDITERKNYEKKILRLATVVEQATQTIVITDLDGNIEYVNPAFEKSTGYTFSEAQGQNPRILKSGNQDTEFYKDLWGTISSGKTWYGIFHNKKKDGSLYYERAVIFPIKDMNDRITNYAAVKQDITNERILEQQLAQAQKMESIGVLAGGVAHDFNNLLTVINGYAEMALMHIDSGNPLYKDIRSILSAGKRAENLTSQLLAFSRKQIYKAEILDINQVISSMDRMLRRLIDEDINIETILVDKLPFIKADASQLEQIFANLVVNARDALRAFEKPYLQKKITIETGQVFLDEDYVAKHQGSTVGRHVFFAVSDNGVGMDEETKSKIFEPFFTTKEKYKGTGLGLSMVYGIVKQNNGSIYVYSEPNEGTMFKIYWPVHEGEVKAEDVSIQDETFYGNETILIVEDEEEVCRFASEALTSLGYNVYKAENGLIALEKIRNESFKIDLIITDLIMPKLNGKEFAGKVKEFYPDIKIIFVSGYTDNHIVHNGLLEEGVNFVHKPYSLKTLASTVRRVLDEK
jgi:PAS domain S-box-containing protein